MRGQNKIPVVRFVVQALIALPFEDGRRRPGSFHRGVASRGSARESANLGLEGLDGLQEVLEAMVTLVAAIRCVPADLLGCYVFQLCQ